MSGLVNYSSSEDSEDEKCEVSIKESTSEQNCEKMSKNVLPLPDDIKGLFKDHDNIRKVTDDPSHHGGRVRSFAHVEGNWATSVFAKYELDEHFHRMQQELFLCLRPLEFQPMDDYHISMSRTVSIRHHWIQDITDTLSNKFAALEGCYCEVDGVTVLVNDEKTRSFLVLLVSSADDLLENYVSVVDGCFQQYNLQKYYQPPVFHVSIGWCLGDVTENVTAKTKQKLKEILDQALQESTDLKYFYVDELIMKTGNKQFVFPLETEKDGR